MKNLDPWVSFFFVMGILSLLGIAVTLGILFFYGSLQFHDPYPER